MIESFFDFAITYVNTFMPLFYFGIIGIIVVEIIRALKEIKIEKIRKG